ncbi:MAG: formamidopyrimidine-DNA glycosylase [Planctomycetia bacterium]|nr:formamidopyrimidine-DNA glycosylase [Planctomycetia bacterium]
MPELPEVETMRRGILAVVGSRIIDVKRPRCRYRPIALRPRFAIFRRRAAGRTICAVGRAGKRVVVELDSRDRIVIEPRMTGLALLADPPDPDHVRLRFLLAPPDGDGKNGRPQELLYWDRRGLGQVMLLSPAQFDAYAAADRIGPDALAVSAEELRARLGASRRAIKVALLDQKALAGVGNLYASEILHRAGIHPARRCCSLTRRSWAALFESIQAVLQGAIQHEGSTLSDGTYRNVLNQLGGYQYHHRVYDRAGERCITCRRGTIVRVVQAQRSTFLCPRCQRQTQDCS